MTDERNDAFVPMRDADGRIRGVMDRSTADYFASKAPDPTQTSLDALLCEVTRVRIVPFANFIRGATQSVLLDTSDLHSLEWFRGCFAIVEDPATFGHCMCYGDPHIELYADDRLIATIGYHHGVAIRWDAWKHDATLREPNRLLDWLSAHGVHGPRQKIEEDRLRAEEWDRHVKRWLEAMPACLRPFWDEMGEGGWDGQFQRQLLDALGAAVSRPTEQVLALFGWFGSGEGLKGSCPSYEMAPLHLLLTYPTPLMVEALAGEASNCQLAGAARYFAHGLFKRAKGGDLEFLPTELKTRLLKATTDSGI